MPEGIFSRVIRNGNSMKKSGLFILFKIMNLLLAGEYCEVSISRKEPTPSQNWCALFRDESWMSPWIYAEDHLLSENMFPWNCRLITIFNFLSQEDLLTDFQY